MVRRAPLLLLIVALAAVCLLLADVLFTSGPGPASDDEAGGLLGDGSWLEATTDEDDVEAGGPTLSGLGRGGMTVDGRGPGAAASAESARRGSVGNAASVGFKGRVMGSDGSPATGVKIVLRGPGGTDTITTGADGEFDHAARPGRYKLLFDGGEAGGLMLRSYLIDGEQKDDLEFGLREPGTIAVNVKRGKEGVVGTPVLVASRDLGELVQQEGATDADGLATFEGLPPGRYDVTAEVPAGPMVKHQTWASSGNKRDVNLLVPEGVTLQGVVRGGKDGPGIAGAVISLRTRPMRGHGIYETEFETGPDGRYEVVVPRSKRQSMTVQADGWAPWPTEKQRRSVDRSLRRLAGKKPVTRNVTLLGGAALSGLVQTEEKVPVPGLALRFKPQRRGTEATVTTKGDGTYAVAQLNPGRYLVQVVTPAWFPVSGQAQWVNIPGGATPKPQTFDVKVVGARKLDGVVTTADGAPGTGVRVWIVGGGRVVRSARDAGRVLETFTDKDGRWVISDIPPDKNVVVRAAMGLLEATPVPAPWKTPPALPIRMKLGSTGTVRGTVVDILTRSTVRGARVVLKPDPFDGRTTKATTTNAQGQFVIQGLLPGGWKATPSRKGYLKAEADALSVPPDGETRTTLRLDPGAVFAGTVVDEGGKPVRWARVTLRGTPDGEQKPVSRRAHTDAKGRFRLTGLKHGSYQATTWRKGYKAAKSAPSRGDQRLQFTLRRGGRS